jgi:hypothetical protein
MTDDLSKPTAPNQFGNRRIIDSRSMQSAQVATLKSGQQNVFLGSYKNASRRLGSIAEAAILGFYDGGNEISVRHETKPKANG